MSMSISHLTPGWHEERLFSFKCDQETGSKIYILYVWYYNPVKNVTILGHVVACKNDLNSTATESLQFYIPISRLSS